jgi:hypothetical protein
MNAAPDLGHVLEDDANNAFLGELRRAVARDAVVPFVGAGLSLAFGYRLWSDILKQQARIAGIAVDVESLLADSKFEEAASRIHQRFGSGFEDIVRLSFDSAMLDGVRITGAPRRLVSVASGPVVTTNYDEVLERAFAQEGASFHQVARPPDEELLCTAFNGNRRYLLKIHDHWNEQASRILTLEQYESYYGGIDAGSMDPRRGLPQALRLMFQTRSVLFLGCSLEKDRYLQILRRLVQLEHYVPMHFALLERPESDPDERRSQLIRELRIFPIFFPKRRFEFVPAILEAIAAQPPDQVQAVPPAARFSAPAAVAPPEPPEFLVESIRSGRCVLFAGAGASFDAGLPSWHDLGHQLLEVVGSSGSLSVEERSEQARLLRAGETFKVVEFCRARNPQLAAQIMKLRLDTQGRDSLTHELLARIPFRGAITSNYDTFIESHRRNADVILPDEIERRGPDGAVDLFGDKKRFPVVKMHGSADRPDTLLIGRDDYEPWLRERPGYRGFLIAVLARFSVFIYGHSLRDPSVQELLEESANDPGSRVARFALLWNVPEKGRRELREVFGIEVVNIEGETDERSARAFLEMLVRSTGVDNRPPLI